MAFPQSYARFLSTIKEAVVQVIYSPVRRVKYQQKACGVAKSSTEIGVVLNSGEQLQTVGLSEITVLGDAGRKDKQRPVTI